MSRSGYTDCCDEEWQIHFWRGAVTSAIRGRRGQAFLRELLSAMDTYANGKLVAEEFEEGGAYCALGTVAKARGMDASRIDPSEGTDCIAEIFGISTAMAAEIMYENDVIGRNEHPELRFARIRRWVEGLITH